MSTLKSSIDWKRRYTLPIALPLDEGDLPANQFDNYYKDARIKARVTSYPNSAFSPKDPKNLRQIGTDSVFLLPGSSRAKSGSNVIAVILEEKKIQDALRTKQYQGNLPDDIEAAVEQASERVQVVFEDYRSALLPLPYLPEGSISVSWPPDATASPSPLISSTFPGVAPITNGGLTFPTQPRYLYETTPTTPGELDPKWIRAAFAGLVRFQRYRQIKKSGANLQGCNPCTSGRMVLWDPEPTHLVNDASAENYVSRSITALAFEGVDAAYILDSDDIGLSMEASHLKRKPALAESYKQLLIFYISHYAQMKAVQTNRTLATAQTDLSPLLFSFVSKILGRLLRTWTAYSKHILRSTWTPSFPDPAMLAEVQSDTPLKDDTIEKIAAFLISDVDHWKRLMGFIDVIFVPFYLGATWLGLGVPASKMPAKTDGSGWWEVNRWAWEALSGLELYQQNWLIVYAGCPLGQPAGFYKAAQIEDPQAIADDDRLRIGEGLTSYEVESVALSNSGQAVLGMSGVTLPKSLARPVEMSQFDPLKLGYAVTIRPYKIEVSSSAEIQTLSVAGTDFLANLLTNVNGQHPILEITDAFKAHPLLDPSLVEVTRAHAIRSLRTDGNQISLQKGDVLEYRATCGSLIGNTVSTQAKVHLKITLAASDGSEQPYIHFRDGSQAADSSFQASPSDLQIGVRMLESGWTPDEAIETFLAGHPLDYERWILLLHDYEHAETTVCAWSIVQARADGKDGSQEVRFSLLVDTQTVSSGQAAKKLALPSAAITDQVYPATFQEKVSTALSLPPDTDKNLNEITGDIAGKRIAFLNAQTVVDVDDGLNLLTTYQSRADTQVKRDAIDTIWRQEVKDAGDDRNNALGMPRKGYETMFVKLTQGGTEPGIRPEFIKAMFHQRIRIVYQAYEAYQAYLVAQGITNLQFPIEVMWALYRIEGGILNVPPGFEMLQRGIPPIKLPSLQKIIVNHPIIDDLIVKGPDAAVSANASKQRIDEVRHNCLTWYHLNLIAMDIYVGDARLFGSGFSSEVARFGFVKTYLMTRKALGLAIDGDQIQGAFTAWYHMLGLLVSCNKGVPFVVVRDPVEMTRTWLLEAMLHLTSMRQGQVVTGRSLVNPIPATLSYLRFNFGEQSFLRIVNIVMIATHDKIATININAFPLTIKALLEKVRDEMEGAISTLTLNKLRQMSEITKSLSDITGPRRKDTRDDQAAFEAVEDKLLRRVPLADITKIAVKVPGSKEQDFLTLLNAETGNKYGEINQLVTWLDEQNLWQGLDDWFRTKELDDLLQSFITAHQQEWTGNNLPNYDSSRHFGHYVSGYKQIFA